MTGDPTYDLVLGLGLAFALFAAVAGRYVPTPYGRFGSDKFGPSLPIRLGWMAMEAPAILTFVWVFPRGPHATDIAPLFFAGIWALHYANRAILFPLLMRARPDSRMSFTVIVSGWFVTAAHAWLYATWFNRLGTHLTADWFTDPRFLGGISLYLAGYVLNVHSDHLLRTLRDRPGVGPGDYVLPTGGGFRWVSSPHYLGEMMCWTGLMVASWCPGGLFVWAVSAANLVPRALATHRWYHEKFPDYPPERRALLPFLL